MFTKTAKKLWVFISSAVASVCLAVGAIAMPPANVAKAAIDGSLSEEVTLNKIVATNGITATGTTNDYISFDLGAKNQNVWVMTQFKGKNAPNYAVNAAKAGLVKWEASGDYNAVSERFYAGTFITNTSETAASMRVHASANTGNGKLYASVPSSQGVIHSGGWTAGMNYFAENTEYIQIIGFEQGSVSQSGLLTYYTFRIANGAASLVQKYTPKEDRTVNGGSGSFSPYGQYVVIYGNIHSSALVAEDGTDNNPESVTFQYAKPATTLEGMLKGVSDYYEYKDDIVTALNITEDVSQKVEVPNSSSLPNSATLDKIVTDGYGAAESVSSIGFSGFAGETWFITQFKGNNSPNFAVRSTKEFDAWSMDETSANYSGGNMGGMLICTSCFENQRDIRMFRGTNTSAANGGNRRDFSTALSSGGWNNGPGNEYYNAGTEYVQIVGYSQNATVASSADVSVYIYKVNNGSLVNCYSSVGTATYAWNALTGSTAVLYGNIGVTTNQMGPDSVTFSYAQPANSLENLIKGLSNKYQYKDDLATALSIDIGTVETPTYSATLEDMEGNTLKAFADVEAVKLPGSTLADFAGWYNKADSKLYKAGEIVALTANTAFVEVATGVALADGAAVRLKNDTTGVGGLRFEAVFSKAAYELLGAGVTVQGGVIPTDLMGETFALNDANAKYVDLTKTVEVDGEYHAYITLTNIKLENFQREFSARVFITVTYADGTTETIVSAYDEEKNSRSIYEVAVKAYNSGKYGENEVLKYYLNNAVNVAVETNEGVASIKTAHAYDGLKADFVRGYAVSNVVIEDGEATFTVTLADTTVNGDVAVTLWSSAETFETVIVAFANGVATVNFTVAL